jgi:hypothetical protein
MARAADLPLFPAFLETLSQHHACRASAEVAAALATELQRYLLLVASHPADALSQSPLVDMAWHQLLLFPRLYFGVCELVRARAAGLAGAAAGGAPADVLIDHDPRTASHVAAVVRARNERTLELYETAFFAPAPAALWPREYRAASPPGSGFSILVRQHPDGELFAVIVEPSDTIDHVSTKIGGIKGIPPSELKLIFKGTQLEAGRTVADYGLSHECLVHIVLRVRGC